MGQAFRQSGRTRPVMDQFAIHPYQDNSSQPPSFRHPNSRTISISDYPKLVALLARAFDGTAQPGSTLPIVYAEYGVESVVPPAKARRYTGKEIPAVRPVSASTQGSYYRQAIQIAFCQPNVRAVLLFLTFDDPNLVGWQSGVYYVDRTPKPTLRAVRQAAEESRRGIVTRCEGLELDVKASVRFPAASTLKPGRPAVLTLECDIDCGYVARLERLPKRTAAALASGTAIARKRSPIRFRPLRVQPGSYRFTVEMKAAVNAGKPRIVAGKPFRVRKQPAGETRS